MSLHEIFFAALLLASAGAAQASAARANGAAGPNLTPLGSERDGNADGSIPAWNGGLTSPPDGIGYEKGKHLPDPFAADKPLFRVTGANAGRYDRFITRSQRHCLGVTTATS